MLTCSRPAWSAMTPPSMSRSVPVMKAASDPRRKAMSRGWQRNDLDLAVDDGRDEMANAPEVAPDLAQVLAASIERSAAQRMAMSSSRSP